MGSSHRVQSVVIPARFPYISIIVYIHVCHAQIGSVETIAYLHNDRQAAQGISLLDSRRAQSAHTIGILGKFKDATSNKCIASSNRCLTTSNNVCY